MKTLVAGGTGFVGTALVRELTARGHEVSVLARNPAEANLPAGVTRLSLDLTEAGVDDLTALVDGHDAVVNLVALSPLFTPTGGNGMHEAVHLDGTRKLVAAAESAGADRNEGARRFVQMSALGADPDGATHYIRAKGRAEAAVRASSLDWTIVRPSVVFGDGGEFVDFTKLLTTPVVTGLPGGGSTRFQPIWVGDLVPLLADCVDGGDGSEGASRADHAGQTYEFGGPEVLTLADVARAIYRAEGRSLRIVPVPMALAKVGLTLGGLIPGFPMGPDQYRSLRFDNTVGDDPASNDVTAFGVDPATMRTFESYLADAAAGDGTGVSNPGESEQWERGDPEVSDSGGDRGESLLTGKGTLALFAFLAAGRLIPQVAAEQFGVDLYAYGLIVLYIPSYLVSMALYDGPLGLEHVTYAVQSVVPGEWAFAWEAGLLATYYLFSVLAAAVGGAVRRRFGSQASGERTAVSDR